MRRQKTAKIGYIIISIVFYIAGLICILKPDAMEENGKCIAGIILIAYGVIKMIGYFSKDLYCLAFQYDFACGLFLIVLGAATCCIRNCKGSYLLASIGILILLDSLLAIQTSLDAKRFGMENWKYIFVFSIAAAVTGVAILIFKTMPITGCALLLEGGMRHYIVHCTVKTET